MAGSVGKRATGESVPLQGFESSPHRYVPGSFLTTERAGLQSPHEPRDSDLQRVLDCGIVAVVRFPDPGPLVEVVKALADGGVTVAEVTSPSRTRST